MCQKMCEATTCDQLFVEFLVSLSSLCISLAYSSICDIPVVHISCIYLYIVYLLCAYRVRWYTFKFFLCIYLWTMSFGIAFYSCDFQTSKISSCGYPSCGGKTLGKGTCSRWQLLRGTACLNLEAETKDHSHTWLPTPQLLTCLLAQTSCRWFNFSASAANAVSDTISFAVSQ